jgi:hypothetical protein
MSRDEFNPIARGLATKDTGILEIVAVGYKTPRVGLTKMILEMIREARKGGTSTENIQQMLIELAEE